ncbi:MAG: class I SAM-dependent methyltransferase [Acidimicrobiia bacterium]
MGTVANVEMARAWDGEEGERWAAHADRYEAAAARLAGRLVDGPFVSPGDAVLDVGCGTGWAARRLARRAHPGAVLGVDLSSRMLDEARRRAAAEGVANLSFEQADAQVHPFADESFDVVVSSFGALFFADPVAAFANLRRALRPGGRLALLAWRDMTSNPWVTAIRDALALGRALPDPPPHAPGPFGLADAGHVRSVLAGAGFAGVELEPVDGAVRLGADADDAWGFVRTLGIVKGLTEDLDEAGREQAFARVRAALAEAAGADGVRFASAAWLVTAHRPAR